MSETTYRNYTISIGATERRDGSIVTEACISVNYQPLHSIFTIAINQDALALELALRWVDEREGAVIETAVPIALDPTYAARRAILHAERARLDIAAEEEAHARRAGVAADAAHHVSVRYFGNAEVR